MTKDIRPKLYKTNMVCLSVQMEREKIKVTKFSISTFDCEVYLVIQNFQLLNRYNYVNQHC